MWGIVLVAVAVVASGAAYLLTLLGPEDPPPGTRDAFPTVETLPVASDGDAADDPAIWVVASGRRAAP